MPVAVWARGSPSDVGPDNAHSVSLHTHIPGCPCSGVCEAYGHNDCFQLEGGGDDDVENGFGRAVKQAYERSPSKGWSVALCSADFDGDGYTNGDELADGCCAFPLLDPTPLATVGHPADASVRPTFPSCTRGALPPAPSGLQLAGAGVGAIRASWNAVDPSVACTCEYRVTVTAAGGGNATLAVTHVREPLATLCGLNSGAIVTVTVEGMHRGGTGAALTSSTFIVPSSGGAATGCKPLAAAPVIIDAAGSAAGVVKMQTLARPPLNLAATAGVGWVVVVGLMVALPAAAIVWCCKDPSPCRRHCVHRYLAGAPRTRWCTGGSSAKGAKAVARWSVADLLMSGRGHAIAVVMAALGLALATAQTYSWYNWLYFFPTSTRYAIARACGYGESAPLGWPTPVALGGMRLPLLRSRPLVCNLQVPLWPWASSCCQ